MGRLRGKLDALRVLASIDDELELDDFCAMRDSRTIVVSVLRSFLRKELARSQVEFVAVFPKFLIEAINASLLLNRQFLC